MFDPRGYFIACILLLASASGAWAQSGPEVRFYNFNEVVFEGRIKRPGVELFKEREHAHFGRLLVLQKSFLPALLETSREQPLQ